MADMKNLSAIILKNLFWAIFFFKKCSTGDKQAWGQDQDPLMWALILAPACMQLYKNTDRSVSRLKLTNVCFPKF